MPPPCYVKTPKTSYIQNPVSTITGCKMG